MPAPSNHRHRNLRRGRRNDIKQVRGDHRHIFFSDKIPDKPIGRGQYQPRPLPLRLQRSNPGIELLLRDIATDTIQTVFPGVGERLKRGQFAVS